MSDITTPEADKIITEFMGQCWHGHIINGECQQCFTLLSGKVRNIYSKSLDALVPVWKEIYSKNGLNIQFYSDTIDQYNFFFTESNDAVFSCYKSEIFKDTIQEAAAIATAKTILELNKKDKE